MSVGCCKPYPISLLHLNSGDQVLQIPSGNSVGQETGGPLRELDVYFVLSFSPGEIISLNGHPLFSVVPARERGILSNAIFLSL